MNKRELPEIRCPYCNKLIARGEALELEFRCGRCKNFFILRAARSSSERPERPQEHCHAESGQRFKALGNAITPQQAYAIGACIMEHEGVQVPLMSFDF